MTMQPAVAPAWERSVCRCCLGALLMYFSDHHARPAQGAGGEGTYLHCSPRRHAAQLRAHQQRIQELAAKVRAANELAKKLQNNMYFASTLRLSAKGLVLGLHVCAHCAQLWQR